MDDLKKKSLLCSCCASEYYCCTSPIKHGAHNFHALNITSFLVRLNRFNLLERTWNWIPFWHWTVVWNARRFLWCEGSWQVDFWRKKPWKKFRSILFRFRSRQIRLGYFRYVPKLSRIKFVRKILIFKKVAVGSKIHQLLTKFWIWCSLNNIVNYFFYRKVSVAY